MGKTRNAVPTAGATGDETKTEGSIGAAPQNGQTDEATGAESQPTIVGEDTPLLVDITRYDAAGRMVTGLAAEVQGLVIDRSTHATKTQDEAIAEFRPTLHAL